MHTKNNGQTPLLTSAIESSQAILLNSEAPLLPSLSTLIYNSPSSRRSMVWRKSMTSQWRNTRVLSAGQAQRILRIDNANYLRWFGGDNEYGQGTQPWIVESSSPANWAAQYWDSARRPMECQDRTGAMQRQTTAHADVLYDIYICIHIYIYIQYIYIYIYIYIYTNSTTTTNNHNDNNDDATYSIIH